MQKLREQLRLGGTRSAMFERWIADPQVNSEVLAKHPIGRFADPAEQAEATLFLLSDQASCITGVALPKNEECVVLQGK